MNIYNTMPCKKCSKPTTINKFELCKPCRVKPCLTPSCKELVGRHKTASYCHVCQSKRNRAERSSHAG